MGTMIKGYNLILKVSTDGGSTNKILAATTSNSFDLKAVVKESIIKDDLGVKKTSVDNHEFEFSAEGFVLVNDTGDTGSQLDRDDLMDILIAGDEVDFVYGGTATGDVVRTGKAIVLSYSEKSDSESDATYSVSFKGNSVLGKETLA